MTKKGKTIRMVVNGVLLAAIVALGAMVYRTGKAEDARKQQMQDELAMQQEMPEESAVDAGTSQVEAEITEAPGAEETSAEETSAEETSAEETSAEETSAGEPSEDELAEAEASEPEDEGTPQEEAEESAADVAEEPAEAETESQDVTEEPVSAIPVVDFTESTLMVWPLAGDILLDYSMDQTIYHPTLDVYKYNPAIVISAAEDSPVLSAANGVVSSIAEDAETGLTVTVDMGNGYQAVYGQLKDVQVGEGQTIGESTIIGYVAPPTKYYNSEGSNLYFAMSRDGQPLDPITYLP